MATHFKCVTLISRFCPGHGSSSLTLKPKGCHFAHYCTSRTSRCSRQLNVCHGNGRPIWAIAHVRAVCHFPSQTRKPLLREKKAFSPEKFPFPLAKRIPSHLRSPHSYSV